MCHQRWVSVSVGAAGYTYVCAFLKREPSPWANPNGRGDVLSSGDMWDSGGGSIRGGGGRGSGTQKFVYQKWPDKIFPIVLFSHDGHFGLGGGGGEAWLRQCDALFSFPSPTRSFC